MTYGEQEESIYNLISEEIPKPERPPRHVSKFPGKLAPTGSTFNTAQTARYVTNVAGESVQTDYGGHAYQKAVGTFGPEPTKINPVDFVRTRSRPVATLHQIKKECPDRLKPTALKQKIKPSLPDKNDKPILNLVTKKNFIVSNAVENILAAPKKVVQTDDDFMNKEDFGVVPAYLSKIKKDIEAEYNYIRELREQEQEQAKATRVLSTEERLALLQGLKAKWEEINSEYQLGTHLTKLDTVGKIARRERDNALLTKIENDIATLKKENIVVDISL